MRKEVDSSSQHHFQGIVDDDWAVKMTDKSNENEDALFLGTDTNVYANEFFAILNGEDKEKTRAAQQDHMRDGINNIHESAKEENKGQL